MTAVVPEDEVLREILADTRRAWTAYRDGLQDLHGDEYERAEQEHWATLQEELGRLERRRCALENAGA